MKTRRDFLREAGIALGGMTLPRRLRANGIADTGARAAIRGLMVDAGRVPESLGYYRRVIDFCAEWELNTLHFRLADDQGSALRFGSVPDLVNHRNAFTPDELRSLAEYAKRHGVDLIPEVESFGHTGYITRSPAYAHLLDSSPQDSSEFNGICPVHPETLHLFEKLYREVAANFPSAYLHGGCDEVNWGGSALSRKALETRSRTQIWAGYLNSLHRIAQDLGKEFIVWGDVVVHKEPEILPQLNKSIILMDWNYSETSAAKLQETYLRIRANGSRAIGAPALIRYLWGPRAGTPQLRNIDAFTESYRRPGDPACVGVILTNWIPSRYLQNSIWDGFAYAAAAFTQGSVAAKTSALRGFAERHYGSSWNEHWEEAFRLVYEDAPYVEDGESSPWRGVRLRIPWSDDEQLVAALKNGTPRPNPYTRVRNLLGQLQPLVRKNLSDFQSFALCVEYLEALLWRESVAAEKAGQPVTTEIASQLIQKVAERDQIILKALTEDWDRGRPADSPGISEPLVGLQPKDQLLFQWSRATAYSAALAKDPERFRQLVSKTGA
ncbi:MAG TPA: family 20 glycosylhydrolase [Silvibacterium sp.]|nr:family 20 glycosylhydrolase [Silvibacterium sp.]